MTNPLDDSQQPTCFPDTFVRSLTLVAALTPLLALAHQPTPRVTLGTPLAEFATAFSDVASVLDLPDGRVIFVDRDERLVRVVDFDKGTAATLGREGDGPGEYRYPMRLVQLTGDTILVRGRGRYTVLGPGATLTSEVVKAPALVQTLPGGSDRQGRMYFQGPTHDFRTAQAHDSVPIYRVDRVTLRPDTVAWIQVRDQDGERRKEGPTTAVSVTSRPFDPIDVWGVARDGTVYIARFRDYHIDIVGPDKSRVSGPPIAQEKLEFTREERSRLTDLPRTRPPFVKSSDPTPRVSPDGMFWVPRSNAAETDPARFDVIDRSGRRVREVVLPPSSRLVGLGLRYIYTAREDADGFHHLQRHAYPK